MERFGRPIDLAGLRLCPSIDLLVTGASAVSRNGVRFGKGHGYFDLEWAIFCEAGLVAPGAATVVAVHDCQLLDEELPAQDNDTSADFIVTPTRTLHVDAAHAPGRVHWERVSDERFRRMASLRELRAWSGQATTIDEEDQS
jgi:5-formyltetrahydrofolate cyclo-ligase